jgi:2-keto-4-pentenoate hydratase/2-oxohepta-3-ene-1,7-dioic acid hydratase in catechol pathway
MRTNTRLMVHDIPTSVSFLSRHVTLRPGDLIFTGTAGKTQPIQVGDVVEVELQGAGILRNKVAAGK